MQVTFTDDKCIIQFNKAIAVRIDEKRAIKLAEEILEHYDHKFSNDVDNGLLDKND